MRWKSAADKQACTDHAKDSTASHAENLGPCHIPATKNFPDRVNNYRNQIMGVLLKRRYKLIPHRSKREREGKPGVRGAARERERKS